MSLRTEPVADFIADATIFMEDFQKSFRQIKCKYDLARSLPDDLICKEGAYNGCVVLKLLKAGWTNDPMSSVPNQTGIFFSVWIDQKTVRQQRVLYNLHALKLRELKRYSLKAREFADAFRKAFASRRKLWPNVRIDYGPQTLMQGWIGLNPATLQNDVAALFQQFVTLCPSINQLMDARRAV